MKKFREKNIIILIIIAVALSCSAPQKQSRKSTEERLLGIFNQTVEERLWETKWEIGNTTVSNEHRIDLFRSNIKNLGGGYIGVGSTQNLTMAAWANSEWVWLVDFTRIVVSTNKIFIAFLKECTTSAQFKNLWLSKSKSRAYQILKREYTGDPELPSILRAWRTAAHFQRWHHSVLEYISKTRKYGTWLTDKSLYNKARRLACWGHIKALRGDLNSNRAMQGIAANARRMGVTIKIIYMSNAEEYFPRYNKHFRKNFLDMPIDNETLILRTTTVYPGLFPWAPGSEYQNESGFHYNIMKASTFQEWLKAGKWYLRLLHVMKEARVYSNTGFSEIKNQKLPYVYEKKHYKAKTF